MDKLERVARALCTVDGHDPEGLYSMQEHEIIPTPGGGHVEQPRKAPLWTKYRGEARRFVAAAEALGGTITSGG